MTDNVERLRAEARALHDRESEPLRDALATLERASAAYRAPHRPAWSGPIFAQWEATKSLVGALNDAAALIASQAARIRELEEGLAPFAALGECVLAEAPQSASRLAVLSGCDGGTLSLEFSDLRAAISLLSRKGGE